jgi:hypothetical protein
VPRPIFVKPPLPLIAPFNVRNESSGSVLMTLSVPRTIGPDQEYVPESEPNA